MTPETYRLAGEVFEQLRDLPEAELAPALDSACGTNEQLRSEVLRLLEANRDAGNTSFLERRAFEDAARLAAKHGVALPAAGSIIGNYRMVARVAAGGMGVVYEGLDLRLARRVAIKILPETFTGEGEERIRRFRREARAASKLNHPHIISIFDAAFADGYHYIAMEFVEGRTLRQIISARTQPDPEMVLDWIAQTASALDAAHQAGIVHRDIKPENIMVRSDGFVKVLDFGLAKLREGSSQVDSGTDLQTRPGNLAGTSRYLSPEQIMGEPAGPRSDIFSLGVVAYELWTGVRPFEGPTDGAVFNAILHLAPAPPSSRCPSLSPEMDGLILRALEKDPDLRFQTAGDLRSACRRVSRDRIASSQPRQKSTVIRDTPIPDAAASRGRGKRRWISAALVGVVGLLGITGAATFWASRTANPPHVTRIVQLTNGETKQRFVTDGTRLYFAAGNRDADMRVYQMSVRGGDPQPIPQLTGMLPFDISPDRTELLLGQTASAATIDGPFPIWVADTVGNAPRRVGDLVANEARYSPSGDEILYAFDRELRTARTDGSHSRLLSSMKGRVLYPVWAPDSQTIRFSVESKRGTVLWEVAPDGTGLRPVPEWAGYDLGATAWTADGKFYFASAGKGNEGGRDLWVIPRSGRLSWAQSKPVRLTSGPLRVSLPAPNQGERRVLFQGSVEVGELVRYDGRSNAWLPYLNGFPAMQVDYAPNGKWIAYARSPDGTIWRSALDGTERVQLTTSPFVAMNPRWSPDGSKITFFGQRPGSLSRIYVAEVKSGSIRQVTNGNWGSFKDDDGSWSPDSNSLVFGATYDEQLTDPRQRLGLAVVDLRTGHITKLPGTEGLWGPRWSPDGRYIAALGFPDQLWLYDWEKRTATRLANIGAGWPSWSRDSQYIYFLNTPGTYWSRMRIKDASVERLIRLSGFKLSPVSFGWVGLTPDGSAISLRQPNTTEIYALDWEEP